MCRGSSFPSVSLCATFVLGSVVFLVMCVCLRLCMGVQVPIEARGSHQITLELELQGLSRPARMLGPLQGQCGLSATEPFQPLLSILVPSFLDNK